MLALLIIIGLMKLESYFKLDCSHDNEFISIYSTMREIIIGYSFYIWTFYLGLFKEAEGFIIRILLFMGSYLVTFLINYYKIFVFDDREIYVYGIISIVLFQILVFICLKQCKGCFGNEELKQISLTFMIFIIGTVDLVFSFLGEKLIKIIV